MTREILVYGIPRGETERHTEDLLATKCRSQADIDAVCTAAARDGFHSFRVTTFDGAQPDFTKVLA